MAEKARSQWEEAAENDANAEEKMEGDDRQIVYYKSCGPKKWDYKP